MKIDVEKLHCLLPVYAYEYETIGETVNSVDFWYPHDHPRGTQPPAGHTGVTRVDEFTKAQLNAIEMYLQDLVSERDRYKAIVDEAEDIKLRRERAEKIIDILFPEHYSQQPEEKKPIRHPAKAWWWQGASITDMTDPAFNGNISVDVESHTGGGDYDKFTCTIFKEWLDVEDATELVHAWCKEHAIRVAQEEATEAAQKRAALIAQKERELKQLKGEE